ncbi:hypothetical protein APX70_05949 [Pseudomonas syringae pv. maculicola]|uniref:Uncharacterized protein n=1 Tax=Pseudomonas syringae pv. maculicola TaxID=59511 RepID=A0A3M2Y1A5_PSEYM|nr:hypothetical protein APX70_05949 [Pseudomonas syringae pv. maculicola]
MPVASSHLPSIVRQRLVTAMLPSSLSVYSASDWAHLRWKNIGRRAISYQVP